MKRGITDEQHQKRKAQQKAAYQRRKAAARARDKVWAIESLIRTAEAQAALRAAVEQTESLFRIMGRPPSADHTEIAENTAVRRSWLATQGSNTFGFVIPTDDPDVERFRDVMMEAEWERVSATLGQDGPYVVAYRFTDEWAVLIRLSFNKYIEPV